MAKRNIIGHVEWRTRNKDRLKDFYGKLFNWKFKDTDPSSYTTVQMGNKEIAGGITQLQPGEQIPTGMSSYIEVEDLSDYEASIQSAGGTILMSKNEVPGQGWFSVFTDPDGNVLALWQKMTKKDKKVVKHAKKAAKKAERQAKKASKRDADATA